MVNSQFSISVHILALLAHEKDRWTSSSYIASSVGTNPAFIRRLLSKLKSAGLVETRNGPEGGAALALAPDRISLDSVFQAIVEEGLYALHSEANPQCPVGSRIERVLRNTFARWEEELHSGMSKVTVADILAGLRPIPSAAAGKG